MMPIRQVVTEFVALGPLPDSQASEEKIAEHQRLLTKIRRPISDEEAKLLIGCFGPDDCYGLAWTLLHLIESAPSGIPLAEGPTESENEWIKRLWARSHRT
jgi:hypothetical protein